MGCLDTVRRTSPPISANLGAPICVAGVCSLDLDHIPVIRARAPHTSSGPFRSNRRPPPRQQCRTTPTSQCMIPCFCTQTSRCRIQNTSTIIIPRLEHHLLPQRTKGDQAEDETLHNVPRYLASERHCHTDAWCSRHVSSSSSWHQRQKEVCYVACRRCHPQVHVDQLLSTHLSGNMPLLNSEGLCMGGAVRRVFSSSCLGFSLGSSSLGSSICLGSSSSRGQGTSLPLESSIRCLHTEPVPVQLL
jgi:hypothetical protein